MSHKIVILHREKAKKPGTAVWGVDESQWIKWETCLRQIYFGFPENLPSDSPDDVETYQGKEAYEFCLHTVCGLKSPMLGETEVWGQFKALFRDFDYASHTFGKPLRRFIDHVFSDTKMIRHLHLTGLGSQSYGSLARRLLRGSEEINIVGSGLLVKDMLPWLVKETPKIRLVCRSIEKGFERLDELKVRPAASQVVNLSHSSELDLRGSLIIAAPIEAEWLNQNMQLSNIQKVVDLRDNSTKDRVKMQNEKCDVIPLVEFFREIETTRNAVEKKVAAAKEAILSRTAHRFEQMPVRPQRSGELWLSE